MGLVIDWIRSSYNRYFSDILPTITARYNGVEVNTARDFDALFPLSDRDKPHYESGIVSFIDDLVKEEDEIVIVGGGWGVTAVKAAQKVGSSGNVLLYEGSTEAVQRSKETLQLNGVSNRVDVKHVVVGPLVDISGDIGEVDKISADELPECDVLELDCEGSEINILKNLEIRPRTIFVESHGMNDAPSSKVKDELEGLSYTIESVEIADLGMKDLCEEDDIYAIAAVKNSDGEVQPRGIP